MACQRKLKSDNSFWMSGAPKMIPFTTFSIIGHRLAHGLKAPQTRQNLGYWQLLNLFFASPQMDNWLLKYVRFKF
jgi:hypothetical protein